MTEKIIKLMNLFFSIVYILPSIAMAAKDKCPSTTEFDSKKAKELIISYKESKEKEKVGFVEIGKTTWETAYVSPKDPHWNPSETLTVVPVDDEDCRYHLQYIDENGQAAFIDTVLVKK